MLAIIFKTHLDSMLVIFGPPGTGKTVTVIEAVRQLLRMDPRNRILLVAPSNSAADLIATRLLDLGGKVVLRMNAPSRDVESNLLSPLCCVAPGTATTGPSHSVPSLDKLKAYKVIVSTCSSAAMLTGVGMPKGHFTHIFMDEAGQASEAEGKKTSRFPSWIPRTANFPLSLAL